MATDDLVLYTHPMSRGRIARWMLEEVGCPYRVELLGYGDTMKSDAFLALNPMGKVPTLVHRGAVVTEAAAICAYLAEAFPDAGLRPEDTPQARAAYLRWLFFAAGPLEQAILAKHLGFDPQEPRQQIMAGFGSYERTLAALEGHLEHNAYVCGNRFTMADVYVGSQVDWGLTFGSIPPREAFVAYADRLQARDAYKAAKAIDNQLIQEARK